MKTEEPTARRPRTARGESVRQLRVAGRTPGEIHRVLVQQRFVGSRVPLAGAVDADGARTFATRDGGATGDAKDPAVAYEAIYAHPDGGVVRLFDAWTAASARARKSVTLDGKMRSALEGLDAEAFVLTDDGEPVPKSPREAHGTRSSSTAADGVATAAALRRFTWLPLGAGGDADIARLPLLDEALPLALGRTLRPVGGDLGPLVRLLRGLARQAAEDDVPIVWRDEDTRSTLLFPGGDGGTLDANTARLVVDRAAGVLRFEPIAHEPSVQAMGDMLRAILLELAPKVHDEGCGAELTELLRYYPSLVIAPERVPQLP